MKRQIGVLATLLAVFVLSLPSAAQQDQGAHWAGGLQGKILGVYKDRVRVQEGLEVIDLMWAETKEFASGVVTIPFGDGQKLVGRVTQVAGDKLVLNSKLLGDVRIPLASLKEAPPIEKAIADSRPQDGPLKPKDFHGKIAASIAATAGNSDTLSAMIDVVMKMNTNRDAYSLNLFAIYGKANGAENANQQLVGGAWRHYFSEDFYSYLSTELSRDEIQKIEFRAVLNGGVGYAVWKNDKNGLFAVEGGLGFLHESFSGSTESTSDVTARAALIYNDNFFENVEYNSSLEVIQPLTGDSSTFSRLVMDWSVPFAEAWSFNHTFRAEYRAEPAQDADNFDLYFGVGVGYKF